MKFKKINAKKWVNRSCKFASEADQITLNALERQIFDFLAQAMAGANVQSEMRVAGGWIRDKLLGKESDDIDISLENMTGEQFGNILKQHVEAYRQKTGQEHPAGSMKSYMTANELRTTGVSIFGQKVEFVNLRSEVYGGDSRKPEMVMGTPEEDAFRRDLTINSMFYNINTGEVEDLTGMGHKDLETMTLRTPLDPKQTFMDDPLRVLRVLRFRSRYPGAQVVPEAIQAMGDPEVHEAYRTKVAPERAGPELVKLLGGQEPSEALWPLFESGMDKAVFDIPEMQGLNDLWMDQNNPNHSYRLMEHTLHVLKNMNDLSMQEGMNDKTRMKMNMAALFHDLGKAHPEIAQPSKGDPSKTSYIGHEDMSADIAEGIMRHIGIGDKDREFVGKVVSLHMRPHAHTGPEDKKWSKKMMGKFLRESEIYGQQRATIEKTEKDLTQSLGRAPTEDELADATGLSTDDVAMVVGSKDMWKYVWLHSIADEMSKGHGDHAEGVAGKRETMDQFQNYLDTPPPAKPLIGGQEIMVMFPDIRPDSGYIGFIKDRLMGVQDAGEVSTPEEAQAFVFQLSDEVRDKYGPKQAIKWLGKNCKS